MAGLNHMRGLPPSHPGELIGRLLEEHGIAVSQAASTLGLSRQYLHSLFRGEGRVSAELAVKLGEFFGNGADLWANLQSKYDLFYARERFKKSKIRIQPAAMIAAE